MLIQGRHIYIILRNKNKWYLAKYHSENKVHLWWLVLMLTCHKLSDLRKEPQLNNCPNCLYWYEKTHSKGGWHLEVAVQIRKCIAKGGVFKFCLFGLCLLTNSTFFLLSCWHSFLLIVFIVLLVPEPVFSGFHHWVRSSNSFEKIHGFLCQVGTAEVPIVDFSPV